MSGASIAGPIRVARIRSTTISTTCSRTERSTSTRVPAEQTWPALQTRLSTTVCAASSTSASAKMICGDLPPSSSVTGVRLLGRGDHHGAARRLGAGEGDAVDALVLDEPRAGLCAEAGDDVHDARRQARTRERLGQQQRAERRLLGRLGDDGVAGGERRREAAGEDLERRVERQDDRADAPRLALGVVEEPLPERDHVAADLVRETAVELEVARGRLDVALDRGQRQAAVERPERRELPDLVADLPGARDQQAATVGGAGAPPRVERGPRRLDCAIDVGRLAARNVGEVLSGRGIDDGELLAVDRSDALAADQLSLRHFEQTHALANVTAAISAVRLVRTTVAGSIPRDYGCRLMLNGKVCVVTGGARGIGRAIAATMAVRGGLVVIGDVDPAGGQETVDAITADGGQAAFVTCDVTDRAQVDELMQVAATRFGGLDVLVTAAGVHETDIAGAYKIDELPDDVWERVQDVNLRGTWWCIKAAAPHLRASERGPAVVTIGSTGSVLGHPNSAAYCSSKAGVLNLTRAAAVDLSGDGVRCNCVCPGTVRTPMIERFIDAADGDPAMLSSLAAAQLRPEMGEPEEIARLVCFLASDDASFVNGTVVVADGGKLAWRGTRAG